MAAGGGAVVRGGDTRGLSWRDKLALFFRSFLLQSVWNPRGMQNVGFCFALLPLAGRRGARGRREFLERHLRFFNTNPVLASYVLGAVAAAEAAGEREDAIESLKKGLASPLGMAGDSLMWGAVRPLAGAVAVVGSLLGFGWAPLALLAVYNGPHLYLRARGIAVGASAGPKGAREVTGAALRGAVRWTRGATAFAVGVAMALGARGDAGLEAWRVVFATVFFLLASAAARMRMPATLVAAAGAAGGVVLLVAGLNGG